MRGLAGLSKLLALRRPLSELIAVRWLLAAPQWAYLAAASAVGDGLARVERNWMTAGFFTVARKLEASADLRGLPGSGAESRSAARAEQVL